MEIGYLSERLRIDTTVDEVIDHTTKHNSFRIIDLDANIIKTAFQIDDIPELHDRLIAASAVYTNSVLITNDPMIRASKHLNTVW